MSSFERCVILVADDEPVILTLVSRALMRHGYVVLSAEDGPSALRACRTRTGPIHLALLDVVMPGMTGPELLECLAQIHPNIEVLFMSGYAAEKISEVAPTMNAVNFIGKPFHMRDLVQRVNQILNNEDVCTLSGEEFVAIHG